VLATMNEFNQDRSRTAEALGISVRTLYNWLKEYQAQGAWTDPEKSDEPVPEAAASRA
jgi:transposase-like protein